MIASTIASAGQGIEVVTPLMRRSRRRNQWWASRNVTEAVLTAYGVPAEMLERLVLAEFATVVTYTGSVTH
jgi:hypothetical protein